MVKIEPQPVTFFRTIPHSQVPLLLISHLGETGSKQTSGVDNKQQKNKQQNKTSPDKQKVATKHHPIAFIAGDLNVQRNRLFRRYSLHPAAKKKDELTFLEHL